MACIAILHACLTGRVAVHAFRALPGVQLKRPVAPKGGLFREGRTRNEPPPFEVQPLPSNETAPFEGYLLRFNGWELPCPLSTLPETASPGKGANAFLGIFDLISGIAGRSSGFENLARGFGPVHH